MIPHYALPGGMLQVREAKGETYPMEADYLTPHRKDYYLFVLVVQGDSRHWVDFIPYTLKPYTFYFTVPEQVHLKEEMRPMIGKIAAFTEDFLQWGELQMVRGLPILQNKQGAHEIHLSPEDARHIGEIMDEMVAEYGAGGSWHQQMLASWLRVLLIYLSRLYNEQYGAEPSVRRDTLLREFQALIGQQYSSTHEVAAYAAMLHLSPNYFSELIKQQSGETALTHIHQRLMMEAKRRLVHTELSIKEISDELGFEDAAYFNRFFKRHTETTPVRFRAEIREM